MRFTLPSFPLLNKELTEQANRKRTYCIRAVLLLLMSTVVVIYLFNSIPATATSYPTQMSWVGRNIMFMVLMCQFLAVAVLLPGIMACVLTSEKERNSLELLLLTRIKPWEIILQKYFSRLIPIIMFIFLSLPIIAIAYSFGGLDLRELKWLFGELFFLTFYIGAWGIFWSAYCRTSSMAIVLTYLSLAGSALFLGILIPWRHPGMGFSFGFFFQGVATFVLLQYSVVYLKERIYAKKGNVILAYLEKIDQYWKEANQVTGGIELVRTEKYRLPEFDPITWYETFKRPAGRFHHMSRIVFYLSTPSICLFVTGIYFPDSYTLGYAISIGLLFIIAVYLMIKASSIISEERGNQTLEVLLTTFISSKQLILARMKSICKLRLALSIPIVLTSFLIYYFQAKTGEHKPDFFPWLLLTYTFLHLVFLSWICCWIGLKIKKHRQAIMYIIALFPLWFIVPLIPTFLAEVLGWNHYRGVRDILEVLAYFSPAMPFMALEEKRFALSHFMIASSFMFVCYLFLKFFCLLHADKYLRSQSTKQISNI